MNAYLITQTGLAGVQPLASGRAGAVQVMQIMAQQSADAARDPGLLAIARGFITGKITTTLRAVQFWVQTHVPYSPDNMGEEDLYHPLALLQNVRTIGRGGDCDDHASLVAAFLLALGIPCRFKAVALQWPDIFDHVFCQAFDGQQWVTLETIRPYALGQEVRGIVSVAYVEMQPGISGWFSSITKIALSPLKVVTKPIDWVTGAHTSKVVDNLANAVSKTVNNPLKVIKEELPRVINAAIASGGNPLAAAATYSIQKLAADKARHQNNKAADSANAEYQQSLADLATQLAASGGHPERAAAYTARLQSAARTDDPTAEAQKIVNELTAEQQAAAVVPNKALPVPAVAPASNPTPATQDHTLWWLGGGAAALVGVAMASRKKKRVPA